VEDEEKRGEGRVVKEEHSIFSKHTHTSYLDLLAQNAFIYGSCNLTKGKVLENSM
jgi:hypothetical protein